MLSATDCSTLPNSPQVPCIWTINTCRNWNSYRVHASESACNRGNKLKLSCIRCVVPEFRSSGIYSKPVSSWVRRIVEVPHFSPYDCSVRDPADLTYNSACAYYFRQWSRCPSHRRCLRDQPVRCWEEDHLQRVHSWCWRSPWRYQPDPCTNGFRSVHPCHRILRWPWRHWIYPGVRVDVARVDILDLVNNEGGNKFGAI